MTIEQIQKRLRELNQQRKHFIEIHDVWEANLTGERMREMNGFLKRALIDWLQANDPNGCYSDRDCMVEFGRVATLDELLENYNDQKEGE